MKFEKYDLLIEELSKEYPDVGKTFNDDSSLLKQIRSHYRKLYNDFRREQVKILKEPLTEEVIRVLLFNHEHLMGELYALKEERMVLEYDYEDYVTFTNLLTYIHFNYEKQRQIKKILKTLELFEHAIFKGEEIYSDLNKKSEYKVYTTRAINNRSNYFSWKKSPEARENLFNALVSKKFIDFNTDFEHFKKAFVIHPERIPRDTIPFAIKWIDRNINKTYTRKSLVYLIDELARLRIIEDPITANKRNRIISYLFSHDGETQLTRLSEDIKKSKPKRKGDIDKIVKNLGNV